MSKSRWKGRVLRAAPTLIHTRAQLADDWADRCEATGRVSSPYGHYMFLAWGEWRWGRFCSLPIPAIRNGAVPFKVHFDLNFLIFLKVFVINCVNFSCHFFKSHFLGFFFGLFPNGYFEDFPPWIHGKFTSCPRFSWIFAQFFLKFF